MLMKFESSKLDDVITKLKQSLPDELGDLQHAGKDKLKLFLTSALENLEMVSREEYDVQTKVLQRTRQRLEDLEQRVALLEKE